MDESGASRAVVEEPPTQKTDSETSLKVKGIFSEAGLQNGPDDDMTPHAISLQPLNGAIKSVLAIDKDDGTPRTTQLLAKIEGLEGKIDNLEQKLDFLVATLGRLA